MKHPDIEHALKRAFWTIKVPSMSVLVVPLVTYCLLAQFRYVPQYGYPGLKYAAPFFLFSFIGAWLIWSIQVPRWRLWAYRRVADIALLEQMAMERQILWESGSFFERTEIASRALRAELQRLRAEKKAAMPPSQIIAVAINAPFERVYDYAANPENLPQWVPSFCHSIRRENGKWLVESPLGTVEWAFDPPNTDGILDHVITLPSGEQLSNTLRIVADDDGCEVQFTLLRRPGMSDQEFAADAALVHDDLDTLRELCEQGGA